MFAIKVPSTLTLTTPTADGGDPVPFATLSFTHPTDDVSKCMVTVTTADGDVHEATFNTNGQAVEQRFTSAQEIADATKAEEVEEPSQEGIKVYPEAYDPNPQPPFVPAAAPYRETQPAGLKPANQEA